MLDYGQGFDPLLRVKITPVFLSVQCIFLPHHQIHNREIVHLIVCICSSVWVCETYVVHQDVGHGYRTTLCTTDLCCAPPSCVVHGAQGEPMSMRSGGRSRHFSFFGGSQGTCKKLFVRSTAPFSGRMTTNLHWWCTSTNLYKYILLLCLTTNMQMKVHNVDLYRHTLW